MAKSRLLGFASLALLTACVTINVYFPAAAAEQVADKIIEDVWGAPQPEAAPGSAPEANLNVESEHSFALFERVVNFIIPAVHAQSANLDISSPAINKLTAQMTARHAQLEPFYSNGAIGLTADGLIAEHDAKAAGLSARNTVAQLIAAENRDRNALYKEIAVANGQPSWEADIRATFARRWIDKARGSWWYQSAGGAWQQK